MDEEDKPVAESPEDYRRRLAQEYYARLRQNAPMQFGGRIQDHANNIQAAQASHLQGAANNVMQAHANEMQSRVSQSREARRMAHERDLQKMQLDAMLARLAMEREQAEKARSDRAKMMFRSGMGGSRTLRNGQWMYE